MKKTLVLLIILIAAMALVFTQATAKKTVLDQETLIYQLTKSQIVNPGTVTEFPEGTFKQGITLEAKAKIKQGSMFPEGKFVLTFDVFAPNADMGPQKAGMYYVVGKWTITKNNADPAELKVKHNPSVASGEIIAELPFDPTAEGSLWTAKAGMAMGLAAGRWSRGEGTLTLTETLEGDLFLDLTRWPAMGQ